SLLPGAAQRPIDRYRSRTLNQYDQSERYRQQVKLDALALLLAGPVHNKAGDVMHHGDGHQHVHDDAKRSDAAEQSDDQAEASEEFRTDGEESQRGGNAHLLGKGAHGAVETVAAKPAQHL